MTQHSVGLLNDLPLESGTKVEIQNGTIAIFRIDDAVYAIDDLCSHAEASLSEGEVFDLSVECPRHGAEFDVTTGAVGSLPATRSVATYVTEIRDGEVFVTVEPEATDE
jgi:3-phenylpropionate/trans-cinnamate dioxygenase ferredoxin subunit